MMNLATAAAPNGISGTPVLSPDTATLDMDLYFPVDEAHRWGYTFTRQRRNGEIIVENLNWKIHGEKEINGKVAWLIGDETNQIIMVSKDEDGLQHHGDLLPDQDDEIYSPPLTTISNRFGFRQPQSSPYVMFQGSKKTPGFFFHQMTGFETLELPAGIFRDCLRADTYFQREGGLCFTSVIHYAPGIGIARYAFRQIDPDANAVIVVGTKKLSYARLNDASHGPDPD